MDRESDSAADPADEDSMATGAIRVLLVEDSPSDADLLQQTLQQIDGGRFEFTWVERLDDAISCLGQTSFDVLLLDLSLPDSYGPETFRRALKAAPHVPIVVLTGANDERLGFAAIQEGVQDYLAKGRTDGKQIARAIRYAIERKQAEEQLRQQREWLRVTLASIGDAVIAGDTEGRIKFLNPAAESLTGWRTDEALGLPIQHVFRIIHEQTHQPADDLVSRVLKEKRVVSPPNNTALLTRDGREIAIENSAAPILDAAGQVVGVVLVFYDVTEKRRAQAALAAALAEAINEKNRLHAVMESLPVGMALVDAQGARIRSNPAFEQLWGASLPGMNSISDYAAYKAWWVATGQPVQAEEWASARAVRKGETVVGQEMEIQRFDGTRAFVLNSAAPIFDSNGQIAGSAVAIMDITERRRAEQAVRESESRERARAAELEALMDAAPVIILVAHDAECRFLSGNRMAHDLLQRPRGSNLSKSAPDGEGPTNLRLMRSGIEIPNHELLLQKAASTGQPVRDYEADVVFEDGSTLNLLGDAVPMFDEDGRPRGAVGVLLDITERRRAEQRLRDAQKLESLGLLAGGIAHDFNNLLVSVIGNASLAQEILPPGNPVLGLLEGVVKAGEQAAHLTRQMLAYSGKGKFVVESLDLSVLIPEMSAVVRRSISRKIALQLDLKSNLPRIEADRGQVEQVFMNLALNASEAIGSHDGLITVRTGVHDLDDGFTRLHPEVPAPRPGKYVFLEVRDTGCGMDDATRAKIFDPFFSTKFTGRGLGLAAVAGIVRGHRAAITVTSALGKGSCFTVLFPAAARTDVEPPLVAADSAALPGSKMVLVVDDEQAVREMAKNALERRGYTVLTAHSGPAAIEVFRSHAGKIALVVLDLSMPNMSGEETLPELRKIRPDVKALVSSGYSEAETMTLFRGQRVSGFIQKPYTSKGIAEKVKVCIG